MSADAERSASGTIENNPEEQGGGSIDTMSTSTTNRKKSMTSSSQKLTTSTGKSNNNSTSKSGQHAQQHQQLLFTDVDSGGEENFNSDSELSDTERNFLTKGAFLLTPSNELTLEKAGTICEKMNFRGPFSLTKTATGILFKFAEPEDCTAVYKKGFHKVTGARFYKKISIPCRPMRTFVVYALDVPEAVPVEDIRHALFKFQSVVEVSRIVTPGATPTISGVSQLAITSSTNAEKGAGSGTGSSMVPVSAATATNNAVAGFCPLVRITLGSQEEANTLLQNGLDFYGATYFPTEAARPVKKNSAVGMATAQSSAVSTVGSTLVGKVGVVSGDSMIGAKIRELLPVFDATGFTKIPAPAERTIKPRS